MKPLKKFANKKAFTLVELIVVIAILAILASVATVSIMAAVESTERRTRMEKVDNLFSTTQTLLDRISAGTTIYSNEETEICNSAYQLLQTYEKSVTVQFAAYTKGEGEANHYYIVIEKVVKSAEEGALDDSIQYRVTTVAYKDDKNVYFKMLGKEAEYEPLSD